MTKLGLCELEEEAALPAGSLRRYPREFCGTLAPHHPVIYKPRVVMDYVVNGTAPVPGCCRTRQRGTR